jgi:hypothetical protein
MGRTSRKRWLKKQEIVKTSPISNEDLYKKLKSWMYFNKWKSTCNLIPYVFETTGRGLMTINKIENNQIILQVPKSLLITTFIVSQSPIKILFSIDKSYSAQCILAIFLIYEKHLGMLSFWKPYLDTFPNSYSNPEFCTKTEKKFLPFFIKHELQVLSKTLKSNYVSLIESIKLLDNNICKHCQQSFYNIFTYHRFIWAYYTVNTRAIYISDKKQKCLSINIKGDDNLALAPLLDLFNHTCETVADARLVSMSNDEEFYQIKTLKSYESKTQVFINYGAHSNIKLYLEYGFFITNNPLDEIFFNIIDIQKCHQLSKLSYNFLNANKYENSMAFTAKGLNYCAKNALFIATSNTLKNSFWKEKIYRQEFNNNDLQLLNNLGLAILQNINNELISILKNMTIVTHRSESFSVLIGFLKEYIEIIKNSLICIKSSL